MQLSGKAILVTGGCGLIGSSIVDPRHAADPSVQVRILDNLTRGTLLDVESATSRGAWT